MSAPFSTSVTVSGHIVLVTADKVEDLDYGIRAVKAHERLVRACESAERHMVSNTQFQGLYHAHGADCGAEAGR